jgi:hypothetical protein
MLILRSIRVATLAHATPDALPVGAELVEAPAHPEPVEGAELGEALAAA